MEGSDRPLRREGFLVQRLDDEVILYDPNKAQAFCLNATASLIWGLCDGTTPVTEMVQLLTDAFPDEPDVADDVNAALERFSLHGSIQMS